MSGFYGHDGYAELSPIRNWDPRTGWSIVRRWRGKPDQIETLSLGLINNGIRFEIEEERSPGGYRILRATYGLDQSQDPNVALSDLWDLVGNDIEKSIWTTYLVRNELKKLFDLNDVGKLGYLARFRADIEALVRGEAITFKADTGEEITLTMDSWFTSMSNLNTSRSWGLDLDVFKKLIMSLSTGVESFYMSQWVLRHRVLIARNSTIKPSTVNIDRIFPTTQILKDWESVPNNLPFDLPDGAWLKRTPTREQVDADKWQIVQEFWHVEDYDNLAYLLANPTR